VVRFTLPYRPLYFLSALGAGGLSVSMFMYFMFLVPHPTTPMPLYEDMRRHFTESGALDVGLGAIAAVALVALVILHFVLLLALLRAHAAFTRTDAYGDLRDSNGEVTLMAIPLTLAMTINVLFILGVLTVPKLWTKVEYIFPFSVAAFTAVGIYGMVIFGRYLRRVMTTGNFDIEDTNHFSQTLPSFAFIMVGVGLAAPAAMSTNLTTSSLALLGSLFFATLSVLWWLVTVAVSAAMILRRGIAVEGGPTLWMGIPIVTLLGITFVRLGSGIARNFTTGKELAPWLVLLVLGVLVSTQILLGLVGWAVMHRQRYFSEYVFGQKKSIAAFGLVCPGVAFAVLSMFFIHRGLIASGIVTRMSAAHVILLAVVAAVQIATVALLLRLNRVLLSGPAKATAVPVAD
jgi:hypothetical protein